MNMYADFFKKIEMHKYIIATKQSIQRNIRILYFRSNAFSMFCMCSYDLENFKSN